MVLEYDLEACVCVLCFIKYVPPGRASKALPGRWFVQHISRYDTSDSALTILDQLWQVMERCAGQLQGAHCDIVIHSCWAVLIRRDVAYRTHVRWLYR